MTAIFLSAMVLHAKVLEKNVDVLDWPGYSTDLNPIKNLRYMIKTKHDRLTSSQHKIIEDSKTLCELEKLAVGPVVVL